MSGYERSKEDLVAEIEVLRRSEELHRATIAGISDTILITDEGGDFTYVCPNTDIIFEYSMAEVQALGNVAKLLGPSVFDPTELDKASEIRNIEHSVRSKSGDIRHLLITVKRVSIDGGTVLYTCRDITDRKLLEDKLHDQLDFLEVLLDAIPGPLFYKNTDHIYLGCNKAFAEFLGLPKEDIVGKSVYDVAPKELADLYRKKDEELFKNPGIQIYEAPVGQSDGSTRYVMFHKATFTDRAGKVAGLMGYSLDITQRRRAEQALQDSEEKYRTLFQQATDAIFIVRPEGEIMDVNEACAELLGAHIEEVRGTNAELYYEDPEDRERFRRVIDENGSVKGFPLKLKRKDGSVRQCILNSAAWRHANGETIAYLSIARDITQATRMERQLREKQKLEAVGTLAGGVAHDFNNLLHIISGHAELLDLDLAEKGLRFNELAAIQKAARRGADLVKGLLTFSRRVDAEFQSLDLNEAVKQAERLLYRTIPKMIDIQTHLDENLKTVNADGAQIEQMLVNLAVNARDAMPEGGVLLFGTENVYLDSDFCEIHAECEPGAHVVLTVSDTGHGMDKDVRQHIFEPFFSTKETGEGSGLGLSVVFGIVKIHGGHISCYSEPGEGTTFRIYFPVSETPERRIKRMVPKMPKGGTETILVVDDEQDIRELAKKTLERAGYQIMLAETGLQAIDVYRQERERISLVILDLIMPEMGGKQCLEELLKIDPHVKVLIASGFGVEHATRRFLESSAKGIVRKPFNIREFLETVRRVLDLPTGPRI